MPICPLWSGLILGPQLYPNYPSMTYTNAIAVNWMRIVKITILKNESKLRAGDFIRKLREGIVGIIKAFCFVIKREKTKKMKSDDLIEEIWERRKKKRSYFEPRKGIFGDLTDFKRKNISNKSKLNSKSKINNFSQYLEKPQNAPIQLAKPTIKDVGNSLLIKESEDSLSFDDGITFHFHGKFNPVNSCWQREKCKDLGLNYTLGIIYENEATNKALEIRRLVPSREKRISPDGNCLFRSLSFVITGTDYNH